MKINSGGQNMFWKVLLIICVFCLAALPVYAQDFKIEEINPDTGEVVLLDRNTGDLWHTGKGQKVQGWLIVEIDQEGITVSRPDETNPWTVNVTRIPVDRSFGIQKVAPDSGLQR